VSDPAPPLAHRAEYLLTRGAEAAVSRLPLHLAEAFGAAVGGLVHRPLGIRSDVVHGNLRRAFPDAAPEWIEAVARSAFRHLGRETIATMRLSSLGDAGIVDRTEMVGLEDLVAALAEGRGAILATGHLGNWEVDAAAIAARGLPMSGVVQRQSNRLVDARLDANRRRLGVETIVRSDARTRVPRALRAGHTVGLVADQDAGRSGLWVPFFGVPASTHRGPALFALRLGSPVFISAALRLPGENRYRVILERVEARRTDDLAADVERLTARLSVGLESLIRLAPEQYFWFHKRWKTPPPKEPSPSPAGTTGMATKVAQRQEGPD
jgi:Kdo2-lipid IVA lauroyltransferase/acyltransferase